MILRYFFLLGIRSIRVFACLLCVIFKIESFFGSSKREVCSFQLKHPGLVDIAKALLLLVEIVSFCGF